MSNFTETEEVVEAGEPDLSQPAADDDDRYGEYKR